MRLYSRTGATALDDPEYGHFEADEQGGFDFPDEVSDRLHRFHVAGRPLWETDVERQHRLIAEELERRRDPATLMSAVEQLVNAAQASAAATKAAQEKPAPPVESVTVEAETPDEAASEPETPAKRATRKATKATPPPVG